MFIQPQKSLLTVSIGLLASIGTMAIASPSLAVTIKSLNLATDFINAGDVTSGNSVIKTGDSNLTITTGGGSGSLDETDLTIDPTAFDTAIPNATRGSAIKTTLLNINAGDVFSIDWNFVTSDSDQAFVTINNTAKTLNEIQTLTTGSKFSYTFGSSGDFVLGVGAVDVRDTVGASTLTVSNPQVTAVPWETDALSVMGTTVLFGFGAWRKSKIPKSKDKTKG